MSPTLGDIRRWNADHVEEAATQVKKRAQDLDRVADQIRLAHPRTWTGDAAKTAMIAVDRQRVGYEDTSHAAQALYRELSIVSDEIMELRRAIVDADELARTYHFRISDDGALVDDGGELGPDQADTRAAAAERLRGDIKRIVESAEKVDAELAAALERADQPLVRLDSKGNQVDRLDIPKNASPQEIADWWKGLSEDEQDELIKTNASLVGNTDGVSVEDRDKANRILLDEKRGYLESERDRVQAELRKTGGPGGQSRRMQLEAELETINGKLSGIKSRLAAGDAASDEADKYYLMQIQHSGDGQAIVARGNPDTADNVTTYIPGTGSELSKIEGDLNRSDKMQDSAHWLDPSKETAVITYMGYEAPDGLSNATQQSYAHDAKKDLDSFQDGLRASHDGAPSNNTVLGHSYGSVVVAIGAHDEGLAVDNAVMVAPPGGVYDKASDLGVDNVYVTIADQDPVDNQPFHGPGADDPDYGADVFESSPSKSRDPDLFNTAAHSEYWDDGNLALDNMGHIIAGNTDDITRPR